LPVARKRDVITTALQELESLGLSSSGSTVDKRLKLPEISPSTESALNNAANVATIGGGIAKIWDALDGSSSSSKRDDVTAKVWDTLAEVPNFNNINWEQVEADKRALKIPASVTTWLKSLGNVGSIGAGGAAIVGAVDGGNSTLKREFVEADERALKIPASVTTWLKSLGNVASIGAGGAAVVGAVDGGSTLKRELDQASNGVDLATLLDGVTPQFEDRSVSSSEVSGLESFLGKAATASSVGGALATVWSALDGSSGSSTKRELAINIPDSLSSHGLPRLVVPTESSWAPGPIAISKKRSDSTDAESTLQQIIAAIESATGGAGIARRSIGITPEQLQQIAAQLNTGTADLD